MLTDRETEVVRLRDEEGLGWAEIGRRLGTTKSSVYSSYRNARHKADKAENPDAHRRALNGAASEIKEPDKTAEAIYQATDPFKSIRQAAEACGFPKTTLNGLLKRMKTRYAPLDSEIRRARQEEILTLLEDRARRALEYADDLTMSGASLRDLMVSAGIAIDKAQLLKGEPTAITSHEDRRNLQELKQALLEELERRQNIIDVTPSQG